MKSKFFNHVSFSVMSLFIGACQLGSDAPTPNLELQNQNTAQPSSDTAELDALIANGGSDVNSEISALSQALKVLDITDPKIKQAIDTFNKNGEYRPLQALIEVENGQGKTLQDLLKDSVISKNLETALFAQRLSQYEPSAKDNPITFDLLNSVTEVSNTAWTAPITINSYAERYDGERPRCHNDCSERDRCHNEKQAAIFASRTMITNVKILKGIKSNELNSVNQEISRRTPNQHGQQTQFDNLIREEQNLIQQLNNKKTEALGLDIQQTFLSSFSNVLKNPVLAELVTIRLNSKERYEAVVSEALLMSWILKSNEVALRNDLIAVVQNLMLLGLANDPSLVAEAYQRQQKITMGFDQVQFSEVVVNDPLKSVQENFIRVTNQMNDIDKKIATVKGQLSSLQSTLAKENSDIAQLISKRDQLNATMADLDSSINKSEQNIRSVEARQCPDCERVCF